MIELSANRRVLLVEDDLNIAHLIKLVLTKSGMHVETAMDGIQALDMVKSIEPGIIVSDIMMPNMDGYAFREQLLKDEYLASIPFVFLTAKDQISDVVTGMEYDADAYIPKPFEPEVLVAKIDAILRKYSRLNRLLLFDALTNVFNRRTLESRLSLELKRVNRYQQPVTIIMTDLDHFKQVNDTYGHDYGDQVLITVASLFKEEIRDTDFVGRVGGEEFVLVLPNTDKEAGLFVANRMRNRVEAYAFEHGEVTFSGGAVSAPEDGTDMKELLKKADQALYRAKENGRNQIVAV